MSLHRVVVTGMAAVTPIGNDLETSWSNLLAGVSGVGPITRFDAQEYTTRFAAEVKQYDDSAVLDAKSAKRMELFTRYAAFCSVRALQDSGLTITPELAPDVGAIIGVGLGGLSTIEESHEKLRQAGPKRISPFFIPVVIGNMAAGQASIFTGAKGPNYCTTSACASGLHAIAAAYTDLKLGRAKAMICGGAESTITPLAVAGFNALKALSTRNDDPQRASRPFDKDRDGFVMGEGSGILILETLDHARSRGARILAEVVGIGASGDAFHMTAPPEDGEGMALAMRSALREAGLAPEAIDHINAHATSTYLNDLCETRALKTIFGPHAHKLVITANKSMIGHLLGAAGGVESVFTIKTLLEGIIPPTINSTTPDPECDLDYTPNAPRKLAVQYGMCNSFGFGGTNCSVIYKRFDG